MLSSHCLKVRSYQIARTSCTHAYVCVWLFLMIPSKIINAKQIHFGSWCLSRKSLDAWAKCVRYTFSDYSSTFGSAPRSFLLHKQEIFDCCRPLLACLSDYSAKRNLYIQLGWETPKSSVNNSSVPGSCPFYLLVFKHTNNLLASFPWRFFKYVVDVALWMKNFTAFPATDFYIPAGLNPNLSNFYSLFPGLSSCLVHLFSTRNVTK